MCCCTESLDETSVTNPLYESGQTEEGKDPSTNATCACNWHCRKATWKKGLTIAAFSLLPIITLSGSAYGCKALWNYVSAYVKEDPAQVMFGGWMTVLVMGFNIVVVCGSMYGCQRAARAPADEEEALLNVDE